MGFRLGLGVGCVGVICALLGACGQSTTDNDEGNGTGGSGSDVGATGGSSPSSPFSGECTAEAFATECDDCPITSDHVLHCDVVRRGVSFYVAPRPDRDGAFLALASEQTARFVSLARDEPPIVSSMPEDFESTWISMTQAPDGTPSVANSEVSLLLDPLGAPAAMESLTPASRLTLIAYDADGALHLHFVRPPDTLIRWERPPGQTEFEEVGSLQAEELQWWLPTSAGSALPFQLDVSSRVLTFDPGSGSVPLHEPLTWNTAYHHVFGSSALPVDGTPGTDDFLVGLVVPGELRVWAGTPAAWVEVPVPLPELTRQCQDDQDQGCEDLTCEQVSDGVDPDSVALARTADGRLWAAWVHVYVDETQKYEQRCWTDDATICSCPLTVTRGGTHAELVLTELLPGQSPTFDEVLRLPTPDVPTDANWRLWTDLTGLGTELALGVCTESPDGEINGAHVRVLEIDTSGL